jgi:hypothetical protein
MAIRAARHRQIHLREVVLRGSSAAGPPDMMWFIDGVWRQRVAREVALLRKLGRQRLRASLRALFDRVAGYRGAATPGRDSARPASRLQVSTNQENDDVHA